MADQRCCKTCRHLRVAPNAAGRIVVRKDKAYPCDAPIPPMPVLPDSVTSVYGFRWPYSGPRYMRGNDGATCPTWEARNG